MNFVYVSGIWGTKEPVGGDGICVRSMSTLCPVAGMVNREDRGLPQDERMTVIGSYQLIIIHKFLHTLQFVKTLTLYTFVINSAD